MRVKIVHRLARLLERQKEYKHSLVLYLHLSLNEEAMRLLALLEPTLEKGKAAQVLNEISGAFEENCMFNYAQRCL